MQLESFEISYKFEDKLLHFYKNKAVETCIDYRDTFGQHKHYQTIIYFQSMISIIYAFIF